MSDKRPVGSPPYFTEVEEMKELIDKYFEDCKGEPLLDDEGNQMLDKRGHPIRINVEPPTVTGLALALGFNSRQSLLNYQAKEAFVDTITRAKAIIEKYNEIRLYDKEGVNGAKFNLSNNYGWSEKVVSENTNKNYDMSKEDAEEIIKKAKEQGLL